MQTPSEPSNTRNTVDRLLKEKAAREEADQKTIGDEQEYKRALNSFAASDNGKIVLRPLIRYMKIFAPPAQNTVDMVEQNGMRRLYMTMFRPYLSPETRAELENV